MDVVLSKNLDDLKKKKIDIIILGEYEYFTHILNIFITHVKDMPQSRLTSYFHVR